MIIWSSDSQILAIFTSIEFSVVPVRELIKSKCTFSFHRTILKGAFLKIKLGKISRNEENYSPICSNYSVARRYHLDNQRFLISIKFQQNSDLRQAVPQFLDPDNS